LAGKTRVFTGKDDADEFCEKVRQTSYPENNTSNAPLNYLHFGI